jgi:hypothetical protein
MPTDPVDPRIVAELDQEHAALDRLADLVVRLDRRLADGGLSEARRNEIVERWFESRLSESSSEIQ